MRRVPNKQWSLKPQDLYSVLVLISYEGQRPTYPVLAELSGVSMSEMHASFQRLEAAGLLELGGQRPVVRRSALKEFMIHGAKYSFPAVRGGMVVGMPTAHAAHPLKSHIVSDGEPVPVWPFVKGTMRGVALAPLYPSAPAAAAKNPALREYLVLFDAIRSGRARERLLARQLLEGRLK